MFLIIFQKSYHLVYDCLLCSPVIGLDLESHSREKVQFVETRSRIIFLALLARRDRDYHMTILIFRDENEITYCYSRVSRRDRDFKKSFLMVEREKMKLTLTRIHGIENSR